MTTASSQTLLVTGASGQLGRRVVELLLDAKAGHIIAATRSPEKLSDLAARGAEVRQADFDSPASLLAAFAGVDRLLLISTDALGQPGLRIAQHRNAVEAASKAGVRHVVYTSLTNPEPGTPITIAPDHFHTEQALAASGLDFTILRNNMYMEALVGTLARAVSSGQLIAAVGSGGASYVSREDCARAAAAALAAPTAGRTTLDITGPAVVTHAELAQIASTITDRPVAYVPVPAAALRDGLSSAGLPDVVVDLLVSFDTAIAEGKLAALSTAVADLTGRAPIGVADFLASQRDALLGAQVPEAV